jgi:hypothetical protein
MATSSTSSCTGMAISSSGSSLLLSSLQSSSCPLQILCQQMPSTLLKLQQQISLVLQNPMLLQVL